ncbi:MAG: hypothetical protein D6803_02450, partial [Anaerolineae bacterium]
MKPRLWLICTSFLLVLACGLPAQIQSLNSAATVTPRPTITPTPLPLPPDVIASNPPEGSVWPLGTPLTLTFNQAMDAASVQAAVQLLVSGQSVAAQFSWKDDRNLQILPLSALPPDARLRLVVAASAQAANGLTLPAERTLTFLTPPPLEVVDMLPSSGQTDVNPASAIVVTFNQPVVALGAAQEALPSPLSIEPAVAGEGRWINTSTYAFYPQKGLYGGSTYTVSLNPDLRATTGAKLATSVSWQFSTVAPRLIETSPSPEQSSVPLDTEITLSFNQPMDASSVEAALRVTAASGVPVDGRVTWDENFTRLTFTPAALLQRQTRYTVALPAGVLALGGAPLPSPYAFSFTTVPDLALLDTNPPPQGILEQYQSVRLRFTAPLQEEGLESRIRIEPPVDNFDLWVENDNELVVYGDFQPLTSYRLTVAPEMSDRWGQTLGKSHVLEFETEPLRPDLFFPSYSRVLYLTPQDTTLSVQAASISQLTMSVGRISWEQFLQLYTGDYDVFQEYIPEDVTTWEETLNVPGDRMHTIEIPLQPEGEQLQPGAYFLRLEAPEIDYPPGPYLLIVSDVQMTLKVSPTQALVWAVDAHTQLPLAGAQVTIYLQNGVPLASGTTDANGLFYATISPQGETNWDYYAVIGAPGEADFAFTASDWNQGVRPYNFGLSFNFQPPGLQTYIYTDRPIYRPGQTVSFRVVVRQAYNGRYSLPSIQTLPLSLTDAEGKTVLEEELPLSEYGTTHGTYVLPEEAQPGYYTLSTPYETLYFQVAEYRKPEINVQVQGGEDRPYLAGESLSAQVQARYFFDAPASDLPVSWYLYQRPEPFIYPGYAVGKADLHWYSFWEIGVGEEESLPHGEGQTDAQGMLSVDLSFPKTDTPYRYILEATVQDESDLPVSARTEWLVHPARYYIAVRPDSWTGRADEMMGFEVRTVDWERLPVANKELVAVFQRVTWERIDPQYRYGLPEFRKITEDVSRADFRTGPDGVARLAFTPPEAGVYQLEVRGLEGETITQALLWVGGAGQARWPRLPNQRLPLMADRSEYAPGDTAQVFVPNPFGVSVPVLVTVERGSILRYFTTLLEANGSTLPLELSEEDAPNVYLSVTLLGNRADGRPDFRQGYINLPVSAAAFELNVEITGVHQGRSVTCEAGFNCPEHLEPRQEVTFQLRVTDAQGNPVQGEFSLRVADLAALMLAEPNAVSIEQAFYGRQPLGVRTGLSLARYVHRRTFEPLGMGGGGGGGEVIVREDFPDTAYWQPQVVTDADGRAEVTLTLPDSLTTWHVDVRGLTADTRVGQAETYLVTSKDLLVRPLTPRFLVVGDHVRIGALVHNNT